ncbi:MAG: hypothetical protein K0R82_803 [Flavipsychrobacter sp.]|nr:hypothetical protein [Flavipsychrobacter sp.]
MVRFVFSLLIILFFSENLKAQNEIILWKHEGMQATKKGKPSPTPYYFQNCSNPLLSCNFVAGEPAQGTVTLHYVNGTGAAYPAFSATVNGVTLSTPAGTLNSGPGGYNYGSIVFMASGMPLVAGNMSIPVSIAGSPVCNVLINVLTPAPTGNCSDPGATVGSTGCVVFNYRGMQLTNTTVRAADGKIWLQQNLGGWMAQDALDATGHYFQWGRWDDGHQGNSSFITGSNTLQDPADIPLGYARFIIGSNLSTQWWGNGSTTDTWIGTTISATNGKDPCAALGSGWHMPDITDWSNLKAAEVITDHTSAFASNLKLSLSGWRNMTGGNVVIYPDFEEGIYWSRTPSGDVGSRAQLFYFDREGNAFISTSERGYGYSVRCVKN